MCPSPFPLPHVLAPRALSQVIIQLFDCVISCADLSAPKMHRLAVNLWSLADKAGVNAATKKKSMSNLNALVDNEVPGAQQLLARL